ncbi:MAG: NmrA family NAD(P)-binding protein [Terriglobia bacterium]
MTLTPKPIVFITGATGQTGKLIIEGFAKQPDAAQLRLGVRSLAAVARLQAEGHDAVYFDLDEPRTFGPALAGVDRLFLLTGYTVAMVHQSKTLIDAARKAGVRHIVNQGVFAQWDCTDPHFAWFCLVESYIEASGIPWTHLHPNMFMEYFLRNAPPKAGVFSVFWGNQRGGWIALRDLADVAAKVLIEGPARHAGQNYWMSTEALSGTEIATILSEVLAKPVRCDIRKAAEFEETYKAGALKIESWYAKSAADFCVQLEDGRMGYIGSVRDEVPHLLGRPAITFREWAKENKAELLRFVEEAA